MSPHYIKVLKISFLGLFVIACSISVVFAIFLHLSPISFSVSSSSSSISCSLECDYRNQTSLDKFSNSKSPTDYENICFPCLFSTSSSLLLSFLTFLLCFFFVFGMIRTAFDDPGYLSTKQDVEMSETATTTAHHRETLKFQWRTSSGSSNVMIWEEGSDRVMTQQEGEIDNENALEVKPRVKYCRACEIYRPPRASHSRKSQRCVKSFDHFCAVTHSDIGSGNITSFRIMVFAVTLLVVLVLIVSVYTYAYLVTRIPPSIEAGNRDYANGEIVALTMTIVCAFAIFPLIAFSLFYLRLWICLGGMTWREYVKRGTVFISHDFATQFDDPCSNCVRSFHCGRGGNLGEVASCCCGLCCLFGYGADGEGPTCLPNRIWRSSRMKWLNLLSREKQDDENNTTVSANDDEETENNGDEKYDPENPLKSEKYFIVPRPM